MKFYFSSPSSFLPPAWQKRPLPALSALSTLSSCIAPILCGLFAVSALAACTPKAFAAPVVQAAQTTPATKAAPIPATKATTKAVPATQASSLSTQVHVSAVPPSSAPLAAPFAASADTTGGYSGQVLEAVLPHWSAPVGLNGFARVSIRISSTGRILSCEGQKASQAKTSTSVPSPGQSDSWGLAAPLSPDEKRLADAACMAAAAAGSFQTPPYGQITEVYLVLTAGNATQSLAVKPLAYVDQVLKQVHPHIVVPVRLGGTFSTRVALRVEADGRVSSVHVEQPSGRADVDSAVLQALTVPGAIPTPPNGPRELILTFTLSGE